MNNFTILRINQYDGEKLFICKSTYSNRIYLLTEPQFLDFSYKNETIDYLMEQELNKDDDNIPCVITYNDNEVEYQVYSKNKSGFKKKKIKNSISLHQNIECENFNLFDFLEI